MKPGDFAPITNSQERFRNLLQKKNLYGTRVQLSQFTTRQIIAVKLRINRRLQAKADIGTARRVRAPRFEKKIGGCF